MTHRCGSKPTFANSKLISMNSPNRPSLNHPSREFLAWNGVRQSMETTSFPEWETTAQNTICLLINDLAILILLTAILMHTQVAKSVPRGTFREFVTNASSLRLPSLKMARRSHSICETTRRQPGVFPPRGLPPSDAAAQHNSTRTCRTTLSGRRRWRRHHGRRDRARMRAGRQAHPACRATRFRIWNHQPVEPHAERAPPA